MTDRSEADLLDIRLLNADAAGMVLERIENHGVLLQLAAWFGDDERGAGGIGRTALEAAGATKVGLGILAFSTGLPRTKRTPASDRRREHVFFAAGLERGLCAVDAADDEGESAPDLERALELMEFVTVALTPGHVGLRELFLAVPRLIQFTPELSGILSLAKTISLMDEYFEASTSGGVTDALRYFFLLGLIGAGCTLPDLPPRARSLDDEPITIVAQASEAELGYFRMLSPFAVQRWNIAKQRWEPVSRDYAEDFFTGGARRLNLDERRELGIPPDEYPSEDRFVPR